jgi:hypothetical protein
MRMEPLFLFPGGLVGIAALAWFGVGSLLTPLLAVRSGPNAQRPWPQGRERICESSSSSS